jgi:electron transport complex protein RnfG
MTDPNGPAAAAPPPSMRESVRLVLTLAVAGLFSGLAIVGAYVGTLPRITENQARALREAVLQVVPGSTRMQGLSVSAEGLAPAKEAAGAVAELYAAYDNDGRFLGYAIPAEGAGFQDTIGLIFGFDPARQRIVGLRVLESRETPGLGDKIVKDPAFGANFDSLAVQPGIVLVKHGTRHAPNEVDGITGATISSKAVVRILGTAAAEWVPRFPSPGGEPGLVQDDLPRKEG